MADLRSETAPDLLRSPLLFLDGHRPPGLSFAEKSRLRDTLTREAPCSPRRAAARLTSTAVSCALMKEVFAEDSVRRPGRSPRTIRSTAPGFAIEAFRDPLWGIRHGDRIAVIYSPNDLSCYWQQADRTRPTPWRSSGPSGSGRT